MTFFKSTYRCVNCQFSISPCTLCEAFAKQSHIDKNKSAQTDVMVAQCNNCGNHFKYLNGAANYECRNCGQINILRGLLENTPKQNEPTAQHTFGANNKQILTELIESQEKEIEQLTKAVEKLKNSVATLKLARDIIK